MSLTKKFNFQFFLPLFLITLVQGKDFEVDFARHVLPILSNKCFACHGPDTKEDKLVRLDLENLAKKDLGGYHAIDPSDLEESELLFRILDEEDPMPPEDFGKTLPMGRVGQTKEIGLFIKSIVENNIKYLSGVTINFDGGHSNYVI